MIGIQYDVPKLKSSTTSGKRTLVTKTKTTPGWWRRSLAQQGHNKQKIETLLTVDIIFTQLAKLWTISKALECHCLKKAAVKIRNEQLKLSIVQLAAIHEAGSMIYVHETKQTKA